MNIFDEIQCEETAEAQHLFNPEPKMEEMAFMQEWMEELSKQEELDRMADLMDAEVDF